jgi:acetyl-CoA decarbonylase/synthase complex subunit gamma
MKMKPEAGLSPKSIPLRFVGAPHRPEEVRRASTGWSWADYWGRLRCRVSAYRMSYTVEPGLYAVGEPDRESDVFVSANYKLSFDILRRQLRGLNAWLLVLDTKGINVWCAAGKSTFGTEELVRRIREAGLEGRVGHRRIILPQLGAPGIHAHLVRRLTGFRVYFGPVRAEDIPGYLRAGYRATAEMRRARFTLLDRLVLTPMEIIPAMKKFPVFALAVLLVFGLDSRGILFREAWTGGSPFLLLGMVSVLSGAFLTPLLLPIVPFRSFALKGLLMGALAVFLTLGLLKIENGLLVALSYIFFPSASSYIALQFTGSTTFTGMSGVKRELRYAIPLYFAALAVSFVVLSVYRLRTWGLL